MTQFGYRPSLHSDFFPPVRPNIPRREDPIELVLLATERKFRVSRPAIRGESRIKALVQARRYAANRLHKEVGLSSPQIGTILNKDHSTILHYWWTDYLVEP